MQARKRPGYLDTVNERVVVFDGAFGTYVQDKNLTADDFGGQHLEGCNELLAVTRPDIIAAMHEDFLRVGVDALETATFGSFGTVLTEYGIADRAHEITLAAARIARDVANSFE
ncbi:MAG: homocysteine S-methyltransferase family protein, partial [Actinomycetota bacterium]